jgi:IS30 family transposase
MANRLKMAKIHAIIGLLEQDWSYRRIARELGVDRETVARYDRLRRDRPNAAIPAAGSLLEDLIFVQGHQPGRDSQCEPFKEVIQKTLDQGLSAQRIWQDLVSEGGFAGSYSSVTSALGPGL